MLLILVLVIPCVWAFRRRGDRWLLALVKGALVFIVVSFVLGLVVNATS